MRVGSVEEALHQPGGGFSCVKIQDAERNLWEGDVPIIIGHTAHS